MPRLLKSLNATHKGAYHFCMNCVNNFRTSSLRDKHHEHCSNNGHIKVKIPTEKEKWLNFHDGQYQFKVPFMLCAYFDSIFPVNISTLFQRWFLIDTMSRRRTMSDPRWANVEYVNFGIYNFEQRRINVVYISVNWNSLRQGRGTV